MISFKVPVLFKVYLKIKIYQNTYFNSFFKLGTQSIYLAKKLFLIIGDC